MAIAATTQWEIDKTGTAAAATNGGGFNPSQKSAGTNYSLKANTPSAAGGPIAAPTGLAMTNASTTLTDAANPFTPQMVGNIIYIVSGTNFVPGWYEITAYTSAGEVTLDRTAVSGGDGKSGVGNIGGCIDLPADAFFEQCVPGNTVFIKGGTGVTYTLCEAISVAKSGTSTAPIFVVGYNDTRSIGCTCDGANRPTIAAGANTLTFASYWLLRNIVVTTTETYGLRGGTGALFVNCKSTNSSASASRRAFYCGNDGARFVDCEAICTKGSAITLAGTSSYILWCYMHDSAQGCIITNGNALVGVVIDTCTKGISGTNGVYGLYLNCTIDNCADGISLSNGHTMLALNNIISNCSKGVVLGSYNESAWWDYNDFYNNDTDTTRVPTRHATLALPGPHDIDADPGYTDSANGDYRTGGNVADTGFGVRLGVG